MSRKDPRVHALATQTHLTSRPIVTTAWILVELADHLCDVPNRAIFDRLYAALTTTTHVEIIPPDDTLFTRGVARYRSRPDKGWSLTDCISFVVMEDRGLTDALTGDHHFTQAGFRALLR